MTTNAVMKATAERAHASKVDQEIAESIERKLTPPWRLQYHRESLDVGFAGWAIHYTPDFVLTNETTGQALAVEIKNSVSLSMLNIIKLQHIQSAFEKLGTDFLVVVRGDASDDGRANLRLAEYGIHAVAATEAASEIEKQLTR